jgi:hypothetical protein
MKGATHSMVFDQQLLMTVNIILPPNLLMGQWSKEG